MRRKFVLRRLGVWVFGEKSVSLCRKFRFMSLKNRIHTTLLLLSMALLAACGGGSKAAHEAEDETIWVSILPLKGVVEAIMGEGAQVNVLVPAGASPESFEPTARQVVELGRAPLVLGVGLLDFEQSLLKKLGEEREIVRLAEGIELIAGSCSCGHHHHHAHGIDPHVWASPRELQLLARNAYEAIQAAWPDSTHYRTNYEALAARIESLDKQCGEQLQQAGIKEFMIYHPALTYYARAYGLEQLAIEHEGKEPSAKRIAELIDRGRQSGCRNILYQSQFPASSVEIIARDLGGRAVAFDPLAEDILAETERLTNLLTNP